MKAKPARVTEFTAETIDARLLLRVLSDFKKGDFTTRLPSKRTGLTGKIYDSLNEIIDLNDRMAKEFDRVSTVVGKEGRIKQRAALSLAEGSWGVCIESVNTLIADLVQPTTEVARVIGAVAKGDLSQTMALEIEGRPLTGEFLRTAKIVNTMVDQLSTFASEVTRVAREVGTEGTLGGQANVPGAAGTWHDLTDNVNRMAAALPRTPLNSMVDSPQDSDESEVPLIMENVVDDDRATIHKNDRSLLIIEDDLSLAKIMMDMARERGFKVLIALRGETGLALARQYVPSAITLDIELPGMDGWTVLDRLKHTRATRHIPVHIISVADDRQRGLRMGAMAFENKPVSPEQVRDALTRLDSFVKRGVKSLLVIEDDKVAQQSIIELIGNGDVETVAVGSAEDAMAELRNKHYDCVVLDFGLPDTNGFELMQSIKSEIGDIPIIIYTGRDLTPTEETELRRLAETIIVKAVRSLDRLLFETVLFLHRVEENLPEPKRQLLEQLHKKDPVLTDKKALIIDDDMRDIFALTSLLERYEMQVVYAENGRDGIEMLRNTSDIDVALVDIMMPEMDGYEAMRQIREMREFKSLPLIALTAKAMKGDREKCIDAGASDYITKPADSEQLLSLLRVRLFK